MHVHLARKKDQAGIVGSPNFVAVQESGATKSFVHQVRACAFSLTTTADTFAGLVETG